MTHLSAILSANAAARFAGQRVLVTGASGFVGSHVLRQGLSACVEIHTLGRRPGLGGGQFHLADLTDAKAIARVVAEIRPAAVIHCAAPGVAYGAMNFADMLAMAVSGTEALYSACAALAQPPVVVHVGSGFEYAPSTAPVAEDWPIIPSGSVYGAAKAASAVVAGAYADRLRIMLLRPFHIYGAGEAQRRLGPHLIAKTRQGERVELTAGEQQRDFLHVDDCARCLWGALAEAPEAAGLTMLNLGSGAAITLCEFIEGVADELRRRGFAPDLALGALPYRAGEPMVCLPDTRRLRATLSWQPRISLAEGIADLVQVELARCC